RNEAEERVSVLICYSQAQLFRYSPKIIKGSKAQISGMMDERQRKGEMCKRAEGLAKTITERYLPFPAVLSNQWLATHQLWSSFSCVEVCKSAAFTRKR